MEINFTIPTWLIVLISIYLVISAASSIMNVYRLLMEREYQKQLKRNSDLIEKVIG